MRFRFKAATDERTKRGLDNDLWRLGWQWTTLDALPSTLVSTFRQPTQKPWNSPLTVSGSLLMMSLRLQKSYSLGLVSWTMNNLCWIREMLQKIMVIELMLFYKQVVGERIKLWQIIQYDSSPRVGVISYYFRLKSSWKIKDFCNFLFEVMF